MKDQVHVRNAEAAQLARTLAWQTGKTISEVVLDALRRYRPEPPRPTAAKVDLWQQQLSADRTTGMAHPETPVEAFYDPETGLSE